MIDSAFAHRQAQELRQQLDQLVHPLLRELEVAFDKRLVATFFRTLQAMIVHRHSCCGLLLSELGGSLLDPEHAPAGTKRLSNLLRSRRWSATLISAFLGRPADQAVGTARWRRRFGMSVSWRSRRAWRSKACVRCVPAGLRA